VEICVVTVIMLDAYVVDSSWGEESNGLKVWILRDLFCGARRRQQLVDASRCYLKQPNRRTQHPHNTSMFICHYVKQVTQTTRAINNKSTQRVQTLPGLLQCRPVGSEHYIV